MKHKSGLGNIFATFCKLIHNHFSTKIKTWRLNDASEYLDKTLKDYMSEESIRHQTSCVNTTQQNELVERKNRHLQTLYPQFEENMTVD